MTMPETTQSDLVARLRSDRFFADWDHEAADIIEQQASEITRLRAHCETMAKALGTAHDLLEGIEQRSADNMWWVKAEDPETACGDAYHAVDTALAAETLLALADGLTPKQREALLTGWGSVGIARSMKRKGLSSGYLGSDWHCVAIVETDLGLAVKEQLRARAACLVEGEGK